MSPHLFLCQLITEALSGQITLKSHIESVKDYISIQGVVKLLIQISLNGKKYYITLLVGDK